MGRDRGPDDYEHDDWSLFHWRPVVRANLLTVIVAVVSLGGQLVAIAWYGGSLEQKVANNQKTLDDHAKELKELRRDVGTQGNSIAATNVAYADILRRLDSIDRKLDRR